MLEFTTVNFSEEVLKSSVPVLVDFFAPWCGPCQMMLPVVEELAEEIDGEKGKVGKVDVDAEPELAEKYGVMSVPTFIVFQDGKEVHRLSGAQAKERLEDLLNY